MKVTNSILRIFEVRARPGKATLLKAKLSDTSVAVVKDRPGNLGYFFGETLASDGEDLVFISIWKDLESIKRRFGAEWEQSFLPEGYSDLIESCAIKHVLFDGSFGISADR